MLGPSQPYVSLYLSGHLAVSDLAKEVAERYERLHEVAEYHALLLYYYSTCLRDELPLLLRLGLVAALRQRAPHLEHVRVRVRAKVRVRVRVRVGVGVKGRVKMTVRARERVRARLEGVHVVPLRLGVGVLPLLEHA
eukprot:scaffold97250_cov46-Phaeocystis_antarctica.AAC.2